MQIADQEQQTDDATNNVDDFKQQFSTMMMDKSSEMDNIFQNSLYTQTPSAENLLLLIIGGDGEGVQVAVNQQKINFQNDLNCDGYFDPETENFQQQPPLPPDDSRAGGTSGAIYLQLYVRQN